MTKNEYEIGLKEIEKEAKKERNKLAIAYAVANNPVKKGEIIRDHSCIILVDTIQFANGFLHGVPECMYKGPRLKKNLKPFVSGEKTVIYQSNLKEIIS